MNAILGIFSGPYALLAKWGVIALLVLSFGGFSWVKGNQHGTAKLDAYVAKQAIETVRVAQARNVVTEKVVTKYVKVKGDTQVVTKTINNEVVKYVDQNPGLCLDAEWRRLHDSAAKNVVPQSTSGTVSASGEAPSAAEALTTVTENYGAATRNADRLDAILEWIEQQKQVK